MDGQTTQTMKYALFHPEYSDLSPYFDRVAQRFGLNSTGNCSGNHRVSRPTPQTASQAWNPVITQRSRWDSNPHTLTGAGFRDRCNTNYATAPETKRPPVQAAGGQKQSGRPDLNRGPLRPERSALPD